MDLQAAARFEDEITHGFGLAGMIEGAVVGVLIGALVVSAFPLTGGMAVAAFAGAIAETGLEMPKIIEGMCKYLHSSPEPSSGNLAFGSPNVFVNRRTAMRAGADTAIVCSGFPCNHFTLYVPRIAEGSATVFVNGKQMARLTSKLVCGARIKSGSPDTYVGGPSTQAAFIWDVEQWVHAGLSGMAWGALVAGGVLEVAGGAALLEVIANLAEVSVKIAFYQVANAFMFYELERLGDQWNPGLSEALCAVGKIFFLFPEAAAKDPESEALPAEGDPDVTPEKPPLARRAAGVGQKPRIGLFVILFLTALGSLHAATPWLLGGDVSLAPKMESAGVVFKDHGQPKDIFAIFHDRGATCIRLRLFVNPDGRGGVVNDLPYTVALARRIKAAGLLFSLDFHYSDTWADPGHQVTPAAWQNLALPQLAAQLRAYTAETLRAFRSAGVTPDVIQIGNEITGGMCWPLGRITGKKGSPEQAASFDRLAALLDAGVQGVHDAIGDPCPARIAIHIDRGDVQSRVQWFFDAITARRVPFDLIGLSFYPNNGSTLPGLRESLNFAANAYHKPIFVAETAYPYVPTSSGPVRPSLTFPLTPEGQRDYFAELVKTVRATPDGLGAGVLWWAPEDIVTPAGHAWEGGRCAMFDPAANALPVFDVLR